MKCINSLDVETEKIITISRTASARTVFEHRHFAASAQELSWDDSICPQHLQWNYFLYM